MTLTNFLLSVFLFLFSISINAQETGSTFNGRLNITSATEVNDSTYLIGGSFFDFTGNYKADSIDNTAIIVDGNCRIITIDTLLQVFPLSIRVNCNFKPFGQAAIFKPTANHDFPMVPVNIPEKVEKCLFNMFAVEADSLNEVNDYYISNDTLYLTTTDSTYAVIVPTSEDIRVDTVVFGSLPFTPSANAGFTVIMSDGTEFPINFEGALDFLFNDVQLGVYTRNDMTFTKSGYDFVLNTYLTEDVAYPIRPKIYVSETEPVDTITDYPDYALFPGYLWKKPSTGEVWQLNQDMDWILISDLIPEMGTVIDSLKIVNDTAYIYLADTTLKAEIVHPVNLDNDPTNEYILEDNIIENGYLTRDDNFNFSSFQKEDNTYTANVDVFADDIQFYASESFISSGNVYAFDLYVDDTIVYTINAVTGAMRLYDYDGIDISTAVFSHEVNVAAWVGVYVKGDYLFACLNAGSVQKYFKEDFINNTVTTPIESKSIGAFNLRDFSILNDQFIVRNPSTGILYKYDFVNQDSLGTAVLNDTYDLISTGKHHFNGGVDFIDSDRFVMANLSKDSLFIFDWDLNLLNQATTKTTPYVIQPFGLHYKNPELYIGAFAGTRRIYRYENVARDTFYTDIPEILDTANYYSYSVEIESDNSNDVRTGIATWLNGSVSYQWCTSDTTYVGWHRHNLDFKAVEHDSIKPVFVTSNTSAIKNVRLFLKQYVDYDLDLDPTNELYDDTDIHNRVDSVSNAILWEDMGTYIRDKQSTKVSVSDGGRLGIGVAIPTATLQIESTDSNPLLITKSGGNLTYLNTQGEQNWLMALGGPGRVAIQRYSSRPAISFYDGAGYSSNNFSMYHTATAFNMGYAATGIDALVIYDDDDVRIGNELRVVGKAQISDLTPTATQLIGADGTKYLGSVGISSDLQLSSSVLGLKNSRPVYRTYHHMEGQTLRPWWADAEDSWYLADERYESVTNSCGLNSAGFFNMGDDYGQFITDSCVISVVYSNTGNGITYADGYMYFVPYASQLTMGADSVKVRTRDRDDIWTTPVPKQAVNIVDADGDYGWIYVNAPVYVREFEITYYSTSFQIAELEYFYIRSNNDIPMVRKNANNVFYRNNTFLGGIGDQYYSFGTTNQILRSDGTNIFWDDETIYDYEFDSTGIYTYVDALDYWNRSNDTVSNDPIWNRFKLDEYGKGMYNSYGNAIATINYDGTFNSMPIGNFDISRDNEYRLEDNYIERINGSNFNFEDFQDFYGLMKINIDPSVAIDIKKLKTRSSGNVDDLDVYGNYLFYINFDDFYIHSYDGIDHFSSISPSPIYTYISVFPNNNHEAIFPYDNRVYVLDRGFSKMYSLDLDSLANGTFPTIVYESDMPSSVGYCLDFGIKDDKWFAWANRSRIITFQFNNWLDFENSTPIDTIELPAATQNDFGSVCYYGNNHYAFTSVVTDSIYIYEISSGSLVFSDIFDANVFTMFEAFPFISATEAVGANSESKWYFEIGRDTTFTTLPEILDTSNYYSYSIEIEGNNIDTVRTGIATWLDGNVSYNWCSGDTLYTGWHRFDLDFKATEHDSIKPVFVIADTTSIKNVRLFLKQYQAESFDDTSIHERIDSVITIFVTHDTNDADTVIGNEYNTTLTLVGTELQLTDGGGTLTQELSSFLDNTDTQGFDVATFTGGLLSLSLDNDGDTTHEFDFDARYLQSEVDGSVTNEGVLSMNTDLANTTFSINSNSSGSVPMYFTEETAVSGNNRAVDLERTGNAITFNLKDADELESVTIIPAADYFLVWDATDSDWKATTISNIPGDGTGTDDQTLSIVSAAAGTISIESGNTIDLTTLVQNQVVQESTTVGTGFDLSGYQIVADFNEFTTDAIPEGDEFIIMYDVSGVTHEKIDIDDLATYIGSGELTTVGTGLSLAGYQVNPDFDAFTQDNTFSGTDEVVYLSFTTHKRGTLAGLGAYMQANWGDGTGTDDQAIYYYLSGSTPALRLDGTSTGMEFDAGEGLVSSGFEEGTLDRILYQHDWTEFNVLSSGVTTSDYLLVLDGTDEARMQISYLATLIGGADGNGLWNSSNSNTTMASGMEPRVNNYLLFESATEAPLFYIDDAATDFMAFKGTTALPHPVFGSADVSVHGTFGSSNDIFSQDDIRAGGDVIAGGWGVFGGFVSVGDLTEGPATGLVGYGSGNHLTNEITIGDNLEFTGSRLNVLTDAEEFYGADPTPSASDVNITMSGTRVSSGAGAGAVSGGNIVVATGLYLVTVSFYAEQGQGIVAVNTFTGSTSGQWPSVYYDVGSSKVSCSQSALVDVTASGTLTYEVDAISGTNEISQFEIIFIKLSD